MFLQQLELTTALRPLYLPGELLLFTQDNIGLYEDKYKLANYQNGQVYLTSHRICYVDNKEPRNNSIAIELKNVERFEFYGGFLKSSPKITLIQRPSKQNSAHSLSIYSGEGSTSGSTHFQPRTNGLTHNPKPRSSATWVCPICTFSNLIPSNFDPTTADERTPVAPCSTCGVKPAWTLILKAAISNASQVSMKSSLSKSEENSSTAIYLKQGSQTVRPDTSNSFQCPRCTFLNHPSLLTCELCSAPLISAEFPTEVDNRSCRTESPGPTVNPLSHSSTTNVKLSFRGGGEKIFHERLKGSMVQRKWLSHNAPPVPTPQIDRVTGSDTARSQSFKTIGIAGLEDRRLRERQNNERVIGSAFEDLEALMASAQEIINLAETFASTNESLNSESNAVACALGLVTTKDMLGNNSGSLYITELTRNLAEFLADDTRGVLRKSGGIISLVDLWAKFNRARGGVELVSPNDFVKAARQWETLRIPFRLREFKSGVLVVQGSEHTDQKIILSIKAWMEEFYTNQPNQEVSWDWQSFGRGITAQETAEKFNWSIGIAEEELEMAEEEGILCREANVQGIRFWINYLVTSDNSE